MLLSDPRELRAAVRPGARVLGLDVGTKTIGTALSDTRLVIASPLETIRRRRFRDDAAALFALIDRHGAGGLVIGLPLALAGGDTPRTQSVRQFARNVLALRDMPVAFWDERLSTVVLNAYLRPVMASYIHRLAPRLESLGMTAQPHLTQSNGGVIGFASAADMPVRTILSGPATGVVGAQAIGRLAGFEDLITFDMGGTSTDVALLQGGQCKLASEATVHGYAAATASIASGNQTAAATLADAVPFKQRMVIEGIDVETAQRGSTVVAFGDSITDAWRQPQYNGIYKERWGKYNPLNIGISGDKTEHVLWRLENGELDGLAGGAKLSIDVLPVSSQGGDKKATISDKRAAALVDALADRLGQLSGHA